MHHASHTAGSGARSYRVARECSVPSKCVRYRIIQFKILCRAYITAVRLSAMSKSHRFVLAWAVGTLLHLFFSGRPQRLFLPVFVRAAEILDGVSDPSDDSLDPPATERV